MPGHFKANLTATAEDDARKRRSGDSPAEDFEARPRSRAGQSRSLSNPGSDAGQLLLVSGSPTGCSGTNGGTLQLQNYVGTVLRWEISEDDYNSYTNVGATGDVYSFVNLW